MLTGKAPVRSDGLTIAKPPTRTMVVNKTLKQTPHQVDWQGDQRMK
jgi:hypothetical protein